MRWTYELNGSYHSTRNMYDKDSVYYTNNRYEYYNVEAWAGYNINSKGYTIREENKELRKLVSGLLTDNFKIYLINILNSIIGNMLILPAYLPH